MKSLKFRKHLSELILSGEKTTTWRLFDDKDLSCGDIVSFLVWKTGEEFVRAKLINTRKTIFSKLTNMDWDGHEKFSSKKEMYKVYSKYYSKKVDGKTPVKVIEFELIR